MALKTWTCLTCEKDFKDGNWLCFDGQTNHVVKEKVYRTLDVPQEPGQIPKGAKPPVIRGRTVVCNIPPPKKVMRGDEISWVGEGNVEFINGSYSTTDPEKQYWLDKKGSSYNATEEQWKAAWYTPEELIAEKEMQLKVDRERLEHDRNELLAATKKKVAVTA